MNALNLSLTIFVLTGSTLLADPPAPTPPKSIVTAQLPGNIIYWRLASFVPEKSWLDLGTQLEQASFSATGIVLDLRSNVTPDDYPGAAQVLGFFAPGDDTLFKFRADSSGNSGARLPDHPFRSPIVLLTNSQTTGAAEVLAARLQADGALVVGRATAGTPRNFVEQKLSSGQNLQVKELRDHPVTPDIALKIDDQNEKAALALIDQNQVLEVIGESAERHRLSEAALVHGQDPEEDAYLASREKKPFLLSLPTIHDPVLISALDSLKAIRVTQKQPAPAATAEVRTASSTSVQ